MSQIRWRDPKRPGLLRLFTNGSLVTLEDSNGNLVHSFFPFGWPIRYYLERRLGLERVTIP